VHVLALQYVRLGIKIEGGREKKEEEEEERKNIYHSSL
jgi:hypothetical protein